MKKKYEKREDVTMTDKLVERTVVKFDYDELFSVVLTDDELNALTADQLREALFAGARSCPSLATLTALSP